MRKVLFLIDTLQTGGAEKSILEIISRFKKYKPVVFQLFPGDALRSDFKAAGIDVTSFSLAPKYNFGLMARQVLPEIKKQNPVLLHSTLFKSDMLARRMRKSLKIPLINSLVNNTYSNRRYKSLGIVDKLKLKVVELWDAHTAKNVDLFISNSEAIKLTNAQSLGIPPLKIKVIYRGRNIKDYSQARKSASETILSHSIANKKVLLNVSRLLDRKGQLDLVNAYAIVRQQHPDTVLLIAGEGPFRNTLENAVQQHNLKESVFLLGDRKDVPALLHLCDYFVFPSHYEGLPGALIEAMFAQKPILASSIPENLECISAKSALLFEPGNVDQLARQISNAITDSQWPDRIKLAHDYALYNFDIASIAEQYETVYDNLLRSQTKYTTF